jgi:hypothetical protein
MDRDTETTESASSPSDPTVNQTTGGPRKSGVLLLLLALVIAVLIAFNLAPEEAVNPAAQGPAPRSIQNTFLTNIWDPTNEFVMWWEKVPDEIRAASVDTGEQSNVRPQDYYGAESCRECHSENYEGWSKHPHRLMSSQAIEDRVVGDFSGQASIEYQGGTGSFYKDGDQFLMKLQRGSRSWTYAVNRTIGSRFTQYYVGKLIAGDSPPDSMRWNVEHVLPLGYWIDEKQWVPTVHVFRERQRDDDETDVFENDQVMAYDAVCSDCHNTYAAGDRMIRQTGWKRLTAFSPRSMAFHLGGYLQEAHPELLTTNRQAEHYTTEQISVLGKQVSEFKVLEHGMSVGISCEACHHGSAEHAKNSRAGEGKDLPSFFPVSPHIHSREKDAESLRGRTDANLNYVCSQCHSGKRPNYANGIDTWNSTEFSDATRGHCYDPKKAAVAGMDSLTCLHCHNPHQPTGPKWKPTPAQDTRSCTSCHEQFSEPSALTAHTHHAADSPGSQCMNCHMPKINEGLQDMVRTHHIFSPTDRAMLEANHPNACNLCHVEQPIDWTIRNLQSWYGEQHQYSEDALNANYPDRQGAVAEGWLASTNIPTRLVGADVLAKAGRAMPQLLDLLISDSHLVNRQFTQRRIDELLGIKMKDMGYQFYMTPIKRKFRIDRIRADILKRVTAREN